MQSRFRAGRATSCFFVALCCATAFLAGCSGTKSAEASAQGEKGGAPGGQKGGRGDAAISVMVAKATSRDVPIQAEVIGTVEPSSTVTLKPQVSGQIIQAYFREGDFVRKGQLLLTLDRRIMEAQLRQAEAQIARDEAALVQATANLGKTRAQEGNARSQLDRATQLSKGGIISKEQYDQYATTVATIDASIKADQAAIENSKAAIAASRAAVETQKVQIAYTNIYAPISGRTGTMLVKPGNVVSANVTDLATINQVQPVYVSFALPENNFASLRASHGQKLPVTAAVDEGAKEQGTLAYFENTVDPTTGTIKLKATFQNTSGAMWPGQFVRVTLKLGEHPGAVLVPNQAVQSGQDGTFVYIVKPDSRVDVRPVTAGQRVGEETVIEKGVQPGETVVTEGTLRLIPGARVQVREPQGPGGPGGGQRRGKRS